MKINLIWLIGAIVLMGLLIFSGIRACNLYDKNSVLKGQAIELVKQLNNQIRLLDNAKVRNADLQTEMDAIIASSEEAISAVAETNNALNRQISQLRETRDQLIEPQSIILNLEEQIETQGKIISNLEFTIVEKDKQIFSLTKKYISERDLRIDTEKALEQATKVIQVSDLRIKGLETKLRGVRLGSKIKTGAIVGITAVVIYGLVKGW